MMIRIVIVLLMFAANASAQNWKEISKAVAIEHKKLLGEAEKFIMHSKVDYYRKLRNRTHFYNIESFHVNHNDTLIMIELYPSRSETRVRIGRRAWLSSALLSMSAFLLQFVCKYPIFCAIDDNFCNYSDTPYFRTPVKEFLPFFFIFQEIPVIAHFPEIIIIVHLLIISHSSNFPFMIVIFY